MKNEIGYNFAEWLSNLSEEERTAFNKSSFENTKAEYEKFKASFGSGYCYVCGAPLASFVDSHSCPHWFLLPEGIRKRRLPEVAERYGFFQIQSYLRWVANEEAFARNINDLREEGSGKLFETTIRFKNFEWSFSCGEQDYRGHPSSRNARHPHYHLQMKVDQRVLIKFNEFHLPFSDRDIINIEAQRALPEVVKNKFTFGEGMSDILNQATLPQVLDGTSATDAQDEAHFKLDTFVKADEGTLISGDDLAAIIEEAKSKGVTVASLLHKLPNVSIQSVVTPGPGVVEQSLRNSRGRSNDGEA